MSTSVSVSLFSVSVDLSVSVCSMLFVEIKRTWEESRALQRMETELYLLISHSVHLY